MLHRSIQIVNFCWKVLIYSFLRHSPDVLADKSHPQFDTKILSKKVRLIRRCLRYFVIISNYILLFFQQLILWKLVDSLLELLLIVDKIFKLIFSSFLSDLHWINTVCNKPLLCGWRALWEISNGVIPREAYWWTSASCVCYCQWVLLFHVEKGWKSVCTHKVQMYIMI